MTSPVEVEEEEDGPTADDEGTDCGGVKGKYLCGRNTKDYDKCYVVCLRCSRCFIGKDDDATRGGNNKREQ